MAWADSTLPGRVEMQKCGHARERGARLQAGAEHARERGARLHTYLLVYFFRKYVT